MSKGRWSPRRPDWEVVWRKLVQRKYGYNPPSESDSVAFGLKAVQIWKRYKRMLKKFGGRGDYKQYLYGATRAVQKIKD